MPLPDPSSLTARRIARTEAYASKIQKMFSETVNELLSLPLTLPEGGSGEMYSFEAESEKIQSKVEQLMRRLHAASLLAIQQGIKLEWEEANKAADAIVKSHFSREARASKYMRGWNARNTEAMMQFIARSDSGMNLSKRIWQSCERLRDEMEVALTVSIGEGEDAGTISRRVRQYLKDPDLMFRRFRYKDEEGRWQKKWKKRIKDPDNPGRYKFIDCDRDTYKVGRGVYKSAAKNAMRVARTETNIAYRRADHARWQGLDFVLGQRVILSHSHPEEDICDDLSAPNLPEYEADDRRGLYPKDFVFDGWHPQCFCFVVPVMVAPEEMAKMNEAFVRGEDYTPKGEQVTEYPEEFKDWVRDNASKIKASQQRGTEPYFVRNNAEVVEGIIKAPKEEAQTIAEKAKLRHDARTPEQIADIQKRWNEKRKFDYASQIIQYLRDNQIPASEWGNNPMVQLLDSIDEESPEAIKQLSQLKRWLNRNVEDIKGRWRNRQFIRWQEASMATGKIPMSDNDLEISRLLSLPKGLPMDYSLANTGRENPHYKRSEAYKINCQTCTIAHELRRRGFAVEAQPSYKDKYHSEELAYQKLANRGVHWQNRVLNPDGSNPTWSKYSHWATKNGAKRGTVKQKLGFIKDICNTDGRYEIYCGWKKGDAHVFLAEVTKGKLRLFDPQSGADDVTSYLSEIDPSFFMVLRIDDKIINPKIMELFKPIQFPRHK